MFRLSRLILAGGIALMPLNASAWRAMNWHEVTPLSGGVIEVVGEAGAGAMDYWCAIGDYAYRYLHTQGNERIYVWREMGPSVTQPGRRAVHFSFTPPPGASTERGYVLTVKKVGYNIRSASARQYCYNEDGDVVWPKSGG